MEAMTQGNSSSVTPNPYENFMYSTQSQDRSNNRATAGELYHGENGSHSIEIHMSPNSKGTSTPSAQPWIGHILVKCPEIPKLMREGLFFDDANIIKEEGYFDFLETSEAVGQDGAEFIMIRHFFLTDLRLPPRWTANLKIYANAVGILHNFKVSRLSKDMIDAVWAWGNGRKTIYHFDATNPLVCFNAIYDDMPLEGWWPWPKRDQRNGVNGSGGDKDILVHLY
ncbi:hypothetical protein F5Y04DRAFT_106348 [Hypomontagnella monticulosa]|nr:hypothetical protein F5Y04DRAFT_106348 [Hypomontagnella monticulosa]